MIFLSILLIAAFVVFCLTWIRLENLPARILAGYLLGFSNVVLVSEAASLLHLMDSPFLVFLLQAVLAVAAVIIWLLRRRPPLLKGLRATLAELRNGSLREGIKRHPLIALLALAAAVVYLFNLVLVWRVAPNTSDALHTHLSRVGYWLQYGSMLPWPTLNLKQVFYPVGVLQQVY